jgi:hypothetical protein
MLPTLRRAAGEDKVIETQPHTDLRSHGSPFAYRICRPQKWGISVSGDYSCRKEPEKLKENLLFLCALWVLLWQSVLVSALPASG